MEKFNIMEVCGTHTMAIGRYGIRNLYQEVSLISGPGCPVCVTPDAYIDYIYELSLKKNIVIATYGDMIRVPGSKPHISLENAKAQGAKVKMVYSSLDAVKFALENPQYEVVFLGIGFETTTPAAAIAIKEAKNNNIKNFKVLSMHKKVEPVMKALLEEKDLKLDGFLLPGHVAVIIGEAGFKFLEKYNSRGVITGFEKNEIIHGMDNLIKMCSDNEVGVKNQYTKLVRKEGNKTAIDIINEVFTDKDDLWRGLGLIPSSGLSLREEYGDFDITKEYPIFYDNYESKNGCKCGDILKGKLNPRECPLFDKVCNPENPVGPCMVSSEGSCAAYFRYKDITI